MKKIRYKTKNIVLLLILLPVSIAFSQNTKKINADSLFVEARKNAFNKEYMIRPGDVQAPRNYSIQYILKL